MAALVATVVTVEKEDPEEEEDTLEAEDIPEAVVELDHHTVKDGEMIMVVAMAEEDMTKVTVVKDMITRDPLVVATVVAIIIIMVAMEDMDMIIMVVVDQEKVAMAVEDMQEVRLLRDQNWILAKFKVLMEIMTLNMVQSILKLAILAKYLEMAKKQELKVIMMRILDQSQRTQSRILANRRS